MKEEVEEGKIFITPDAKVFLAKFSILLFIFPLATVFLVRDFVAPSLQLKSNLGEGLAIVSAVIVVQLILVWSCVEGFKPERDERQQLGSGEGKESKKSQ